MSVQPIDPKKMLDDAMDQFLRIYPHKIDPQAAILQVVEAMFRVEIEMHMQMMDTCFPKTGHLPDGLKVDYLGRPIDPLFGICNHSYKMYNGLNESFEYCEHCGVKK